VKITDPLARDRAAGEASSRGSAGVPQSRTLALVLRTIEVFETSLVVTLFTRELGKVGALAKGARRPRSSLEGGLDLLGVSDIVLIPKASEALDLLTEAAPVERFASLRRDLAALYAGYYVAELLNDLTDLHDPHPKLFDAARITLRHLGESDLRVRRMLRFELACLRELGLMPALDACAHCGTAVAPPGEGAWFGLASGGVLCDACGAGQPHVVALSAGERRAIRALASPGDAWRELDSGSAGFVRATETVGAVMSHVLGHRPRLRPSMGV
jgi:DNA repair protein RecO (recombination protein O)